MMPCILGASRSVQVFFDDGLAVSTLIKFNVKVLELIDSASKISVSIA